jgi:DNA invertase Pin-like site-specific DNA recombinase
MPAENQFCALNKAEAKRTVFDTFPPPFSTPALYARSGGQMKIGYARVSTQEQNLQLQTDALRQAGCSRVLCDSGASGMVATRPALKEALQALQAGDVLVTWRLDRLGRSLSHLITLITDLEERGVAFRSICESIDTSTAPGRLMFHVLGALAEFERALIAERTIAGLAAARARGQVLGRPVKLTDEQIARVANVTAETRQSMRELAKSLSVSTSTLRRALGERMPKNRRRTT